jgi:hypothetical protein
LLVAMVRAVANRVDIEDLALRVCHDGTLCAKLTPALTPRASELPGPHELVLVGNEPVPGHRTSGYVQLHKSFNIVFDVPGRTVSVNKHLFHALPHDICTISLMSRGTRGQTNVGSKAFSPPPTSSRPLRGRECCVRESTRATAPKESLRSVNICMMIEGDARKSCARQIMVATCA